MKKDINIIGLGNMGEALAIGLQKSEFFTENNFLYPILL